MSKKIKDSELKAVLASLEADLNQAFEASKETLLAKAAGDKSPDDSAATPAPDASPSPSPEASDDVSAPGPTGSPGPSAPPAPDASASPAAPPMDAAPSPSADPAAAGAGDAPLSPEALQAEYSQLSPEELDMHIKAALAAKEALMGAAGGPPGAGAPMASPSAAPDASPAAPMSAPDAPPAMKAEAQMVSTEAQANGGKIAKSEADLATAAKLAELENLVKAQAAVIKSQSEDVENLTKGIKMVSEKLSTPVRKAVTGIAYLNKSEEKTVAPAREFSAAEVREKIKAIVPSLSKSERDLVVRFYSGRATAADMTPILEKVK